MANRVLDGGSISRDEALALPSEAAATLALRTQQVIAHETSVADIVDPLGGSYAIESLTDQLQSKAQSYIDQIDERGGMVTAIEDGFPQREIENAAYAAQLAIERGSAIVVGVNQFTQSEEALPTDLLRVDPNLETDQKTRLAAVKQRRDNQAAAESCRAVESAAKSGDNLMPSIRAAVRNYATVGEIADAMRNVFGVYQPNVRI